MSRQRYRQLIAVCMLAAGLALAGVAYSQDGATAPGTTAPGTTAPGTAAQPPADASRLERLPAELPAVDTEEPGFNSCAECHYVLGGKDEEIVDQFNSSVHKEMGFGCTDCHGGDASTMMIKEAMSPAKGFIGKPERKEVLQICARCHSDASFMRQYGSLRTDQLELYKTSVHGQALLGKGDPNVAVCSDCHTAHEILRVKNPNSSVYKKNIVSTCARCHGEGALMYQYGLDPTIPEQYADGEHGKRVLEEGDMGAPVCNDCHGNHGAKPPGIESIEHVCGQCHLQTEKYYEESKHAAAFAAQGMGRCVVCHNQHRLQKPSDDYMDPTVDANCVKCHDEQSAEYKVVLQIQQSIKQIGTMQNEAQSLVEQTELTTHLSMHDITPQVEQIHTKLLTARAMQHASKLTTMEENLQSAQAQFDEIKAFTTKLLERARFNKLMVMLLAALLVGYGVYLLIYKKRVLDVIIPWQYYEGPSPD